MSYTLCDNVGEGAVLFACVFSLIFFFVCVCVVCCFLFFWRNSHEMQLINAHVLLTPSAPKEKELMGVV